MLPAALTAEQEAEAKVLEAKIQKAIQTEIADLARLMVSKSDRELFGRTEFQVRDLVLRVGGKVYEEHLREKKRLPRFRSDVSEMRASGGLSGLSSAQAFKHHWANRVPTRLLLLPSLRRHYAVG